MSRSWTAPQAGKPHPGDAVPLSPASAPAAVRSAMPGTSRRPHVALGTPRGGVRAVVQKLTGNGKQQHVTVHARVTPRFPVPPPLLPEAGRLRRGPRAPGLGGHGRLLRVGRRGWARLTAALAPAASAPPGAAAASRPWCAGTRSRTGASSSPASRAATTPRRPGSRLVSLAGASRPAPDSQKSSRVVWGRGGAVG